MATDDSQLLQQFDLNVSQSVWQRYDELKAKRQNETLTPQEQEELIGISDKIELANAQRMEALSQLALLRQTSLDDLMAELEIHPLLLETPKQRRIGGAKGVILYVADDFDAPLSALGSTGTDDPADTEI